MIRSSASGPRESRPAALSLASSTAQISLIDFSSFTPCFSRPACFTSISNNSWLMAFLGSFLTALLGGRGLDGAGPFFLLYFPSSALSCLILPRSGGRMRGDGLGQEMILSHEVSSLCAQLPRDVISLCELLLSNSLFLLMLSASFLLLTESGCRVLRGEGTGVTLSEGGSGAC